MPQGASVVPITATIASRAGAVCPARWRPTRPRAAAPQSGCGEHAGDEVGGERRAEHEQDVLDAMEARAEHEDVTATAARGRSTGGDTPASAER